MPSWRRGFGVGPHTIGKWRNRFITDWIEGLYDEIPSGRPRTVEDEAVAELITKTLARKPKAATHWSVRAIAKETGIAKSTVHACSSSSVYNLTAPGASSFRPIPSSSRGCGTWSDFISIRRQGCSALRRREESDLAGC
jgi:hypothetical protein